MSDAYERVCVRVNLSLPSDACRWKAMAFLRAFEKNKQYINPFGGAKTPSTEIRMKKKAPLQTQCTRNVFGIKYHSVGVVVVVVAGAKRDAEHFETGFHVHVAPVVWIWVFDAVSYSAAMR